jgi:L-lactate dehydrogenase
MQPTRIAVIGAGHVGSTFAYTLLLRGLASELVLVDVNRDRAEGEAMDLSHSAPLAAPVRVTVGGYEDCAGAAVTVITGGAAQKPGETRLDLARRNVEIFREIVPRIAAANPEGILLVATNPVDVLTHAALELSGLPPARVIGSGTVLDSARFRHLLSRRYGIDPHSVHAYVIGEHGDSEVPLWSLANIAGMRLDAFCEAHGFEHSPAAMSSLFEQTRDAAYRIIERKGATYYAIAAAMARIVEAIVRDQKTVLTVSSLIEGAYGIEGVCLSLPAIVGRGGVERVLRLELDPEEEERLRGSARKIRESIAGLEVTG